MNDPRTLRTLPSRQALPQGLILEKPARNLASLATTQALAEMQQLVLSQWKNPKLFADVAKHGIRPVDRLLFFGPPGNGKTMASQWLAAQIGVPLYRVQSETLVTAFLGGTSTTVGNLMEWLSTQPRCVVLLDEVEMLFPSRESGSDNCSRELTAAGSVFWQYLDRWESPTLFILATNMEDRLDPAMLSRIDIKLEFGPPTPEQSSGVIKYWAETLHEHGGSEWGPMLDDGRQWESFRAIFHAVQWYVRQHIAAQ